MQAGKIFGCNKQYSSRWTVQQIDGYSEIASMRQAANAIGYKTSKPLYEQLEHGNLPINNKNGHQYFILEEIINWAREQGVKPFIRPRYSIDEIHDPIQHLTTYIRRLGISDRMLKNALNTTDMDIKDIIDPNVFKNMEMNLQDILDSFIEGGDLYVYDSQRTFRKQKDED